VQHPRLAGVHLNIEPCPSGDINFLKLLDELRQVIPSGKILSVAAFPPPTFLHPFDHLHWDETYFGEVSRRADQIVVMMYDTGLPLVKPYRRLVQSWTYKVLLWTQGNELLLGVPTYEDAGVGYHYPRVENLENALSGIYAGLAEFDRLPEHYQGIAIYSEWETDDKEWDYWTRHFMYTQLKEESDSLLESRALM
jgi:spore germination protein YaaH